MNTKTRTLGIVTIVLAGLGVSAKSGAREGRAAALVAAEQTALSYVKGVKRKEDPRVARGAYLVWVGACHDCHTPLMMTAQGPAPDFGRALSGHPAEMKLPPAPKLPPGPWNTVVAATLTAWSGPWGTSFTANLTPDRETGLGAWTEQNFIDTLRNGKHMGRGRPLLPPMPYQNPAGLTDEDLKAVFAFLQAIPPVKNRVPQPIPPAPEPTAAR